MNEPVFLFSGGDPAMLHACDAARRSFKYFWRELSWEGRRIIPGLDMSMVKLPFSDGPRVDSQPEFEHMWVGEIDFDGETLSGQLLNSPNWLSSVREGDFVRMPFSQLEDWMMTANGRAYGGFTVNLMRSRMGSLERQQHDQAWGLDFGDPTDIRIEVERDEAAGSHSNVFGNRSINSDAHETFRDHPMCISMVNEFERRLSGDPSLVQSTDQAGWTLLHREALAGNYGIVKLLVHYGIDVGARTTSGRTAAELARKIGWAEIADYLDRQAMRPGGER